MGNETTRHAFPIIGWAFGKRNNEIVFVYGEPIENALQGYTKSCTTYLLESQKNHWLIDDSSITITAERKGNSLYPTAIKTCQLLFKYNMFFLILPDQKQANQVFTQVSSRRSSYQRCNSKCTGIALSVLLQGMLGCEWLAAGTCIVPFSESPAF